VYGMIGTHVLLRSNHLGIPDPWNGYKVRLAVLSSMVLLNRLLVRLTYLSIILSVYLPPQLRNPGNG